jgi:hypothetical protein
MQKEHGNTLKWQSEIMLKFYCDMLKNIYVLIQNRTLIKYILTYLRTYKIECNA